MSRQDRERRDLHAWHDGELSWLGRRRVARRLARDPAARRELEALALLRRSLREGDPAGRAEPGDLWDSVRSRLPEGAPRSRRAERTPPLRPAWVAAGLGLLAVGIALAILLPGGHAPPTTSLRWLRVDGQGAVVLEDDQRATIIWVLKGPPEHVSRRTDGKLT